MEKGGCCWADLSAVAAGREVPGQGMVPTLSEMVITVGFELAKSDMNSPAGLK